MTLERSGRLTSNMVSTNICYNSISSWEMGYDPKKSTLENSTHELKNSLSRLYISDVIIQL